MRNVFSLVVAGMARAGTWRMQAQDASSLEERYRWIPDDCSKEWPSIWRGWSGDATGGS